MTRVLIVDDKVENLYYLQALLTGHGFEVESARHGAEALVKARHTAPDLIVSDLLMPVMDGYTLLRQWKADTRLKDIPFIVYTATYTETEDEKLALDLGADAFILKPAEPDVFLARIREVNTGTTKTQPKKPEGDENALLKLYSTTLIRKLEEKSLQLEAANQTLQESELKFRQLAENINEVFWMTDPDKNRMIYLSPAYEKIWGRPCASVYAEPKSWMDAVHADDKERVVKAAMKQAEGTYDEQYRIVRPDGEIRWIRDRAFPVSDQAGLVYRIVGVAEDTTQSRLLEEQLRQAQKMEGIGQLAGGVAHDFNNILTVMQGHCALMQMDKTLSDELRSSAAEIQQAAERAANLTRQLLMFSRRQSMQPRDLDLNEVISNITKMLHRVLGEDIRLQLNYAPQPLYVHADAGMLDQVLMNLTVNSRDAMPKGGQLTIETSVVTFDAKSASKMAHARPGSFACLSVTDNGSGITAGNLPHIFEPFFTTKDVGKGTGLGLATVFGIVQQHQGWITVESEVGRGTTFRIHLPRLAKGPVPSSPDAAPVAANAGSETILVAEDDPSLRQLIRTILSRLGYRILEAPTGVSALEVWKQNRHEIRLLLTDMVMPDGMSGRDLALRLLQDDPKLKVIYTSGYSAELEGLAPERDDEFVFLAKPFNPRKLAEIVRSRLDS